MEEASPEEAVFPAAVAEEASQEEAEAATPSKIKATYKNKTLNQIQKPVATERSV